MKFVGPARLVAIQRLTGDGCTCRYEWRSLGRLYNVDMGEGWVRTTDPRCPEHIRG